MPSLDSERPFDCWNNDLNVFAAGGVADGDGSRLAYLKGFASIGVPAFLDRGEEDWNPWTGEPSPSQCADSVCDREVVGAWIIIGIQLYVSPPADW